MINKITKAIAMGVMLLATTGGYASSGNQKLVIKNQTAQAWTFMSISTRPTLVKVPSHGSAKVTMLRGNLSMPQLSSDEDDVYCQLDIGGPTVHFTARTILILEKVSGNALYWSLESGGGYGYHLRTKRLPASF